MSENVNCVEKWIQKKFVQKLFVKKNFGTNKILGNFFLNIGSKKMPGQKTFWVPKKLGPVKIGSKKFVRNLVSNR